MLGTGDYTVNVSDPSPSWSIRNFEENHSSDNMLKVIQTEQKSEVGI